MSGVIKLGTIGQNGDEVVLVAKDRFASQVAFQLNDASWVGTVTFYGSMDDGVTYFAIQAVNLNTGTGVTTATAAGLFRLDASCLTNVKVKATAYTSGALGVFIRQATG